MTREAYIYGLYSTDNPEEIRYIGVSVDPAKRLKSHKYCLNVDREYSYNPHKGNWFRKVYDEGYEVEYKILSIFYSEHDAYASEDAYIEKYKENHRIVNLAVGGRGGCITPPDKLEKSRAKQKLTVSDPEYRKRISKIHKERFNKPGAREARSELSKKMWDEPEYVRAQKEGMRKAQEETDYLEKAAKARQTPEWREAARQRGRKQFESPEARAELSRRSKEMWAKRSPEERIPWNKGLRTTGKDYNITGFKAGSEELKQHSAEKSREYYAKLKEDPELYKKHMDARSEVPEKVSKKNKANWDALSEEERKLRGLKMSLGKKYSKAKKNNWVLDLSPKPCPRCGEQQ